MKYLLTLLLLIGSAFAQNTTYKDGTECNCDSIHSIYYKSGKLMMEVPFTNGKENAVRSMYHQSSTLNKNVVVDSAYWYNSKISNYCTIKATTPSDYVYSTFDRCDNATTTYKWAEDFRETLKIKSCKASFVSKNKNKLIEYLEKCVKYTIIEHDDPNTYYTLCGVTTINTDGTSTKPSKCEYDASWWKERK